MVAGARKDMQFEVRGHVVAAAVVVVIVVVAVADVEGAVDVADVAAIEDGVVAARNRAVVDRLVRRFAVRSVDVTDHDLR